MSSIDEVRLSNGDIRLISHKRRRALAKMGRVCETRWSNSVNSYVRERSKAKAVKP